jgi:hypothetical protein
LSLCQLNITTLRAQEVSGLSITPLNHTIQARPGARTAVEFVVNNGLKSRVFIDVQLRDITQGRRGSPILREAGSTPRSAAPWIQMEQGRNALASGQNQTVRANIIVPRNVSGSYHAVVVIGFSLRGQDTKTEGSVAAVVNQAVLPIHIFITGTQKNEVELENAELKPAIGNIVSLDGDELLRNKWVLVPRVRNSGNSMVRIKGDVIVTSNRGELVGRYQVSDGDPDGQAILPGATIEFPIFINSTLPDPQYPARINLRYQGTQRVEGYSAPMTLKPRVEGSTEENQVGEVSLGTIERTGLQALVEPRVVIGNVQPRSIRTQRITVTNLEDFPVTVNTIPSGLAIDTDGEPIALPDAAVADWMKLAPAQFRLGPQQSRVVSVRMYAPTDASDRWGMLEFRMNSADPKASTLTTTARTSVLLRNAANPVAGQAAAQGVALTRSGQGPIISVTIANNQDRPLAFSASALQLMPVALASTPTAEKGTASEAIIPATVVDGEKDIVLLPHSARRLDFQLSPYIQAGEYFGTMKANGVAADARAPGTEDFTVQFKLNLTNPVPPSTEKPAEPATPAKPDPKKPATEKPAAEEPAVSLGKTSMVKRPTTKVEG